MSGLRRRATTAALLSVLLVLGLSAPTIAEERVVRIDRDGVQPRVLRIEAGDTVRFVNDDPTFAYRAQSDGGAWRFDSGPTALLEGDFSVPAPLTRPGLYAYRVAQDAPFRGQVVVAGGAPSTAPASASPSASPGASPGASPSASPGAAPTPTAVVAGPAVRGPLAGPPSSRALGLAVAVAAVLLLGAGSLLLRLLLAVPVSAPARAPVLSDRPARL